MKAIVNPWILPSMFAMALMFVAGVGPVIRLAPAWQINAVCLVGVVGLTIYLVSKQVTVLSRKGIGPLFGRRIPWARVARAEIVRSSRSVAGGAFTIALWDKEPDKQGREVVHELSGLAGYGRSKRLERTLGLVQEWIAGSAGHANVQ